MSDLISRQTRVDRLDATLQTATKLKVLLDPDVKALLDAEDAALVGQLLAATDDETRREKAAQVNAWRRLRTIIAKTANDETYAVKKLKELTNGR